MLVIGLLSTLSRAQRIDPPQASFEVASVKRGDPNATEVRVNVAPGERVTTELQRHAEELKHRPSEWMPWNYRETLARLARPAAA
jgi:hypothetical protein